MIKTAILDLYKQTLPEIIRDERIVREIIDRPGNHIIPHIEQDAVVGVSVIGGNVIYLLCVADAFQGRGIGSALLTQSEAHVAAQGYDRVIVGAGDNYIMPGIPMNRNAHLFFKKRGYSNAWGDSGSFDMMQDLANFPHKDHAVGDVINGIWYRWATAEDMDGIVKCVTAAQSYCDDGDNDGSFVPYYKETSDPVLVAVKDGEIVGTLMVGIESEGPGIGSVGCTTTMPQHMGQGIATQMVILGTKHLKDLGLPKAFLGYTYKDIISLYARAGYAVCMEYYMGEKQLRSAVD